MPVLHLKEHRLGDLCDRCGGVLEYGIQPCDNKEHGEICTQVHIGFRCTFCGKIIETIKSSERPGKSKRILRSTIGEK
jgi:transcription initiation factor IIE alpha subunit